MARITTALDPTPVKAWRVRVEYTNASGRATQEFLVLAKDQPTATRILFDSGVVQPELSTIQISEAAFSAVVIADANNDPRVLSHK